MAMLEGMDDLPEVIVRTEEDKDVEKEAEPDATNPEQVIDNAKADEDGESEGEEEEEYEIEAIIQAKKGYFESGETGYLVKWKNYGSEHNSWVRESDAGNAQELIQSFWKKKAAHLRANRTGHLARSSSKITRSTDTSSPAKRGYVKKEESSDSDGDEQQSKRRKMKGRASTSTDNNGQLKRESLAVLNKTDEEDAAMADPEVPEDDNAHIASMRDLRHMSEKSWEDVVKTITTVEMAQDELMVFFETTDGSLVREPSRIFAKRCPQKLIKFYEAHLRWRIVEKQTPAPETSLA